MMSDSIGICKALHNQEDKLRQHSIYILPDDSDTDFDFYVLVDSEEAREKNEFLKKLHAYLTENNENNRNKLLNSLDENDPGLKILIEKYPYRLFVAIDKNKDDWKVNGKTPLDEGFPWNSEFIKKRICWIDKNKLKEAFNQNNKNILEIKELNDKNEPVGNNILIADDYKFRWQERAKLWLYYKWVEHLMECKGLNELSLSVRIKEEGSSRVLEYYPLTINYRHYIGKEPQQEIKNIGINNNKIKLLYYKEDVKNNIIAYRRHEDLLTGIKSPSDSINQNNLQSNAQNFIYSEFLTGTLDYFSHIAVISDTYSYKGIATLFLMIENAILTIGICDERVIRWWTSLNENQCAFCLAKRTIPLVWKENGKSGQPLISEDKLIVFNPDNIDNISTVENENFFNIGKAILNGIKEIKSLDILILHQGLLDKDETIGGNKITTTDLIARLKDKIPYIIITSGRGEPDNIPNGVKFMGFSNIEKYICRDQVHKFILTRLIM